MASETESSANQSIDPTIDQTWQNELVKFDNKNQTSMFFVTSKAIMQFCKDFADKNKINISNAEMNNFITQNIPEMIMDYTSNVKKRYNKKPLNPELVCIAMKTNDVQCTKKKYLGTDYCKTHHNKTIKCNKVGTVTTNNPTQQQELHNSTEMINGLQSCLNTTTNANTTSNNIIKNNTENIGEVKMPNVAKKRGRKRKIIFDPRQYDTEYLTLWEDIVDNQKVLIDVNNNVYTFDTVKPKFIGKKTLDMKIPANLIVTNPPPVTIQTAQIAQTAQTDIINNIVQIPVITPEIIPESFTETTQNTDTSIEKNSDNMNNNKKIETTIPKKKQLNIKSKSTIAKSVSNVKKNTIDCIFDPINN